MEGTVAKVVDPNDVLEVVSHLNVVRGGTVNG